MNEEQELRFKILEACGFDVDKARVCLEFVMESKEGEETKSLEQGSETLKDGVYLIDESGRAVKFEGEDTHVSSPIAYVGIKQGKHSVAIALQDVSKNRITLTSKKDNGAGRYFYNYIEAIQDDWQGKRNTEHLKAVGLNPAIQLKDGEYIPTMAELYLICLNQRAINAAMRFAGGDGLRDFYWSSTEFSEKCAWNLNLDNINTYNNSTKTRTKNRVRLVKKFL